MFARGVDSPRLPTLLYRLPLGRAALHHRQGLHSARLMAARLLRHQAPAPHHRGTHQCHPSRHGARRSHDPLCRAPQPMAVAWHHRSPHRHRAAQAHIKERGHQLVARQVDILHHPEQHPRSHQRAVRQIPHGIAREWRRGTQQSRRTGMVQHLPAGHDARHAPPAMDAHP